MDRGDESNFVTCDIKHREFPNLIGVRKDLAPDSQRFIAHCKWLLSQNCGLAVFGTNSEANSLSLEERAMLLDELVAAGVDPARMMPGTGCCSIMETVKLTAQAVEHGCAGVLMLPMIKIDMARARWQSRVL